MRVREAPEKEKVNLPEKKLEVSIVRTRDKPPRLLGQAFPNGVCLFDSIRNADLGSNGDVNGSHLLYAALVFVSHNSNSLSGATGQIRKTKGLASRLRRSRFISIDCGMPEDYFKSVPDYGPERYYRSDKKFVNTGINSNISEEYKPEDPDPRLASLRSFPQGTRNCYTLRPEQGKNNTYVIRAWFWYGNYDEQKKPPKFDIHIGENQWQRFAEPIKKFSKPEIMYVASTDCIHVCLLNTDEGTPFISALELVHLNGPLYNSTTGGMDLYIRNFMGSSTETWITDDLGRGWSHQAVNDSKNISTTLPINSTRSTSLPDDNHVPVEIRSSGEIRLSLVRTNRSTLPPILNALEIYLEKELLLSDSCEQTKNRNTIAIIVASVVPSIMLLSAIAILWSLKRRRRTEGRTLKPRNRRFTHSEVVNITNNFERVIGKGGFGTVFLGYLEDGTEVAVKMLSRPLSQGSEQFWTEAKLLVAISLAELLTTVHHRNVASLIGYCDQGSNTALLYEYMANGNLKECLQDQNRAVLTWKQRLQIAIDAAQGLPTPIRILFMEFGLVLIMIPETSFCIWQFSFWVIRTAFVAYKLHYNWQYCITSRLTEKSDVYSFGIVLLELITGQPAVIKNEDNTHIVQWVMPMLERGEINSIADPRLQGDFDSNSVWKALEIAIACVPSSAVQRLSMSQVLGELNECLEIYLPSGGPLEISKGSSSGIDYSRNPLDLESSMSAPQAR
ncbi:hypothetical protein RHSIM_Rhsim08G0229300 [Rhododendron simsii]|uniref:Protein kinase domain-containing protein n=1 Tax=Rhododendron simsii TaxID=118357 RepID=A0A834GHV7_RHOSS|nr:hypothetical protein RHSIM_Rhsim08G0229300 [Rhododendron simsii]